MYRGTPRERRSGPGPPSSTGAGWPAWPLARLFVWSMPRTSSGLGTVDNPFEPHRVAPRAVEVSRDAAEGGVFDGEAQLGVLGHLVAEEHPHRLPFAVHPPPSQHRLEVAGQLPRRVEVAAQAVHLDEIDRGERLLVAHAPP